jgi:hypothetical protein
MTARVPLVGERLRGLFQLWFIFNSNEINELTGPEFGDCDK